MHRSVQANTHHLCNAAGIIAVAPAAAPIGKYPVGKYPVGKYPVGKYSQPVVTKG
jgi:hypothetical protein